MIKGRPRSSSSHRAILDATLYLIGNNETVTIEAIARRAKVGKQTIYRWWGSTGEIFLEILLEHARIGVDESSKNHDLQSFLNSTFQTLTPPIQLTLKLLLAESIKDDTLKEKFIIEFITSRRSSLKKILQQTDSLISDNETILIDFIFGLIWQRVLFNTGSLNTETVTMITHILQK